MHNTCLALWLFGAMLCRNFDMDNRPTNRLAHEKSPYLLQHQHNPVDWFPWGEEAFAKARAGQKPIFLSVGYSTCHWCHVMEHESFENENIARQLNEHFISIKVDREERPDVDRVYMTFVQATTGSGGWPMNVFLTPDLKPFAGGTYFPPEDRYGRAGFPTVLTRIAEAWEKNREAVVQHGNEILAALEAHAVKGAGTPGLPDAKLMEACCEQIARSYDPDLGGFGNAPKFPRPVTLNFLFRFYAREPESAQGKRALEMGLFTLRKMAAGGMHDQLGGGFHRYSVDRFWHIPHFEKMLYDQAQLACSYLEAFQITHEPFFAEVARDILDYVQRDMTDQAGGFYSAEDADSLFEAGKTEHGEGAFYVWTKNEIERVLGESAAEIFNRVYGVEAAGNAPAGSDPQKEFEGKNTLIQRMPLGEAARFFKRTEAEVATSIEGSRRKLLEVRSKRPRPHLDDKVITSWNGLMISAFARASAVLDEPKYLQAAQRAAAFVLRHLGGGDHVLRRNWRQGSSSSILGFADDYAFLIQALLDLYEADFDVTHLQDAAALQEKMDALFWDAGDGGYFSVRQNTPDILLRMKEDYDGAEPSPNSVAALNLLRLAQIVDSKAMRDRAGKTIAAFGEQLRGVPTALPQMLVALDSAIGEAKQIVIAGKPGADDTRALLREVNAHFEPRKILLLADEGPAQQWLGERLEFIRSAMPINGKAAAYVCENFVCKAPVVEPAELRELLTGAHSSE